MHLSCRFCAGDDMQLEGLTKMTSAQHELECDHWSASARAERGVLRGIVSERKTFREEPFRTPGNVGRTSHLEVVQLHPEHHGHQRWFQTSPGLSEVRFMFHTDLKVVSLRVPTLWLLKFQNHRRVHVNVDLVEILSFLESARCILGLLGDKWCTWRTLGISPIFGKETFAC